MQVMLVDPNARVPRKGSETAAGFDVYAVEDVIIPARVNVKRTIASLVLLSVVATLLPISALVSMLAFIFLLNTTHIPPKGLVSTGIRVAIPRSYYGRLAPRSGLALKHGIDVGAGVIDADYRGDVKVLLFNFGTEAFQVRKGDRIAQLIVEKISPDETMIVVDALDDTVRDASGFGSTGK